MNWLQKISQDAGSRLRRDMEYFSIGHGDPNEETFEQPEYLVWVYCGGRILQSEMSVLNEEGEMSEPGTHGSLWSHEVCDKTYKGRYEPSTGRISIVRPAGREKEEVPGNVMRLLHNTFNIREIRVF